MYYLSNQNEQIDVPDGDTSACAACDCSGNVTLNVLEENVLITIDEGDETNYYYWFFMFCVAVFIIAMLKPRRKK